jgi:hypothetical protein
MAVGAPILAIGSKGSELENLIEKHDIGFYSNGNEIEELVHFIKDLYQNKNKAQNISMKSYAASKNYNYFQANQYLF